MRIKVKVTPNAKQQSIQKQQDLLTGEEIYHIKLRAKPQGGEANDALIAYLSEYFGVPKRQVTLVQGATSRWKLIEIQA